MKRFAFALCFALVGCTSSTLPQKSVNDPKAPAHAGRTGTAKHYDQANNAPEISRSRGEQGGAVVLWPRVIPKTDDPAVLELAARVQARLAQLAEAHTSKEDKSPSPKRV